MRQQDPQVKIMPAQKKCTSRRDGECRVKRSLGQEQSAERRAKDAKLNSCRNKKSDQTQKKSRRRRTSRQGSITMIQALQLEE